jgi:hypothetical protein
MICKNHEIIKSLSMNVKFVTKYNDKKFLHYKYKNVNQILVLIFTII